MGLSSKPLPLGELVTIAVSPRERQSSLIPSLLSLFATIPPDVRVIVAQGDLPEDLRQSLEELRVVRPFDLIATEFPLYPQEARNLCIEASSSEYIVIADNDMQYEAGWLDALVRNAITNQADIVAPVIFIGPPRAKIIHHAGGRLRIVPLADGKLRTTEEHQFSNRHIAKVDLKSIGVDNDAVEFHCFLVRADYCKKSGPLDERLITQEQIHYGLLARNLGAKVTFESEARVTYNAKTVFTGPDLQYLTFRWNDHQALESMRAIEEMWGIFLNQRRMLGKWVRQHRVDAYATLYVGQHKRMSLKEFFFDLMRPIEIEILKRAMKLRNGKTLNFINPIDPARRDDTIQCFLTDVDPRALPTPKSVEAAI